MSTPGRGQRDQGQGICQLNRGDCWPGRRGSFQPILVSAQCHVLSYPSYPSIMVVEGNAVAPAGMVPLHHLETRHRLLPAGRGQTPDPWALRTHTALGCERHLSAHQVQEQRDSQPLLSEQWGSQSQGCILQGYGTAIHWSRQESVTYGKSPVSSWEG